MKKFTLFLALLLCLSLLVGCQEEEPVTTEYAFTATVLDVSETQLLVAPDEGTPESKSSDKIYLPLENKTSWPIPQVGDTVNVVYDGIIQELYPARIPNLYRVEILNN